MFSIQSINKQAVITVLLILVLFASAYFWFQWSSPPVEKEVQYQQEFGSLLQELATLRNIKLNIEVLRDERFKNLVSFELPPFSDIKPGRRIPYLPF